MGGVVDAGPTTLQHNVGVGLPISDPPQSSIVASRSAFICSIQGIGLQLFLILIYFILLIILIIFL